ncbi:MAG: 2OG-Fe(II) oxygenase [Patescibacteria group bacterium]|nr:2OG-Fe(II) oxygenase [Patescibacteria group bacterium]MDE1944332.1 2OG-Fe(II) oxygenase [Patescibacteria group bacterium]MDE1944676.1 2OG-Fe(II) oxygenase [Patescibacteria group bacterium]MDE2057362.1 2OG-Fe(II) oxygenase [Patescibacteria group bacterium]
MLEGLRALKDTLDKRRLALAEAMSLDDFLTPQPYTVEREPFPHVVADDFFKPEQAERLNRFFYTRLADGCADTLDYSRFHAFRNPGAGAQSIDYDGYVYMPRPEEDASVRVLFSLAWNLFFSDLFAQPTGFATTVAFHHHPAGDHTGFVHDDHAVKAFSSRNRLANGVVPSIASQSAPGDAAGSFSGMRSIAVLYFFGGGWKEGDGGETGLYADQNAPPAKRVAPLPNRLLAFQISPRSLHAFQANKTPRDSFVQWFHTDPRWARRRYRRS